MSYHLFPSAAGVRFQETGSRCIAKGLVALTEWSINLLWADRPEPFRRRCAVVLADDLAAIVAAHDEPELKALHDGMARSSGGAEATVFPGRGMRLDRYSAPLANGSAPHRCELHRGYPRVRGHGRRYGAPAPGQARRR